MSEARLTLEEEAGQRLGEIEFYYQQADQRKWDAEQQAKASVILGLLRQHLPAQVLKEAEELLSTLRQTQDGRYGGPLTHRSYTTPWGTTVERPAGGRSAGSDGGC